jgi:predicted HAD superfamily Cof-like phosphohydrolase
MNQVAQDVAEFHSLINQPPWVGPIAAMPIETLFTRNRLILEETQELIDATNANDVVGIADALADIVYVAYGTAYTYGIDLDAVLAEVHRSNMSKDPGPTGKAVKGARYSPPDVVGVLARAAMAS